MGHAHCVNLDAYSHTHTDGFAAQMSSSGSSSVQGRAEYICGGKRRMRNVIELIRM